MSIKQNGGVFGRNPTFNDVEIEGDLNVEGTFSIGGNAITGLDYEGTWDASTGNPPSASPITGQFWIVSVAGSTDLSGITNWAVGDWVLYNGSGWNRLEGGADGNFVELTSTSTTVLDGTTIPTSKTLVVTTDIGSTVQAHDAGLDSISGLTTAADKMIYTTASDTYAVTDLTAAGRAILDDADADAQRTTLGVGTGDSPTFAGADLDGAVVVNESGADVDFRVESDTDANALFVEGSSGNVGIGTSSPGVTLDVAGQLRATGSFFAQQGNASSGYQFNGDGNTGLYSSTFDTLQFSTANEERMRIDSSGNVGIGITSPYNVSGFYRWATLNTGTATGTDKTLFEIAGSISSGSTEVATIHFANQKSAATGRGLAQIGAYTESVANSGSLRLFTTNAGTTSERLRITSTGNVGIGTTSPATELDVNGTITADGADIDGAVVINESGADVDFRVESDTATNALFVEGSSGNVGVGTSSPQAKFSVSGGSGQLIHHVYDTHTFATTSTWYRVAKLTNNLRGNIELYLTTAYGAAYGAVKINLCCARSIITASWYGGNSSYCIRGVRTATDSGQTYLEVMSNNSSPLISVTSSYIKGNYFEPLEFTSAVGSVAETEYMFADFGSLNNGYFTGLKNNYNYNIITNATERLRITGTGNVGIGTTSPATELDVNGTITADGADLDGAVVINESGADVDFRVESDTDANALFVDGATGSVGIGTNTPARKLHVNDVMRLEPRATAPSTPAKGDIYFDSSDDKLKCYDGTVWQDLF